MARRKTKPKGQPKEASSQEKLLVRVHERHKVMTEADQENRRLAVDDMKFANEPGAQWEANMKKERGNRPCYEFNKCRVNGKRVINEIRANRPQVKVRAVEDGDKETAELYEGLIRNIYSVSDFDTVTDQAAEYQVDGGMAAWRVVTEYASDDVFDQDIFVKPIKNPFCLYADPACQDVMKRDAEDWILTERISKKAYEARWPDAEPVAFEESVEFDDQDDWEDGESVRICEYWYKEPYEKEIWLVPGPQGPITVDSTSDEGKALAAQPGFKPLKTRTTTCPKIMMCIVSGDAVLEGPVEWAGSMFPFVMIYGEYKVIDGKVVWWGLHRFAKDAQRSYNVSRTAIDETIALAPQAKWWATAEQAKGLTDKWAEAHKQNLPWLPYNADPAAMNGGPPQRMPGADVPIALLQQAEVASQDLRDVTGLHEASFGEESGEKSGIALARKQHQAAIVTYNYPDNIAKGHRRTGEILIDLIPEVYDAERELRILGADGKEAYERVNQLVFDPQTGKTIRVNDLTSGKYDLTVTTGPSFATRREEAATLWSEMASKFPQIVGVAGDLIAKSTDLPYSQEIGERLQLLLPPQIQQQIAKGKPVPAEVQVAMAQVAQQTAMVQQHAQLVQQAAQELETSKAEAVKDKAAVDTAVANLKTQKAQFDAHVEKQMAAITRAQADLVLREAQSTAGQAGQEAANDRQSLSNEVQQAVGQIQQLAAEFQQQALATLAEIMAKQQTQVFVPPRPRVRAIRAKRVNGELVAEPEYEDQMAAPAGIN